MKTIAKIKFGSHLYGTSTPESDTDYKSVHIPDASDILLQRVARSIKTGGRSKDEGEKNLPNDIDSESFSFQQYLQLLAEGQTVAIDMLFAPDPEITTPLWKHIQANSEKLLTNRSASFVGYCRTQANKYGIKGSRVAAARDAANYFRGVYQILGSAAKVRDGEDELWSMAKQSEHMDIVTVTNPKSHIEIYFECCNRKVPFTASVKLAAEIFTRIFENYGDRAKQAEMNEGIDWKALSHAVRVGEEAIELMATGKVTFPLRNRDHILAIKQGTVPFAQVSQEIEDLLDTVEKSATVSILRDNPDTQFIDGLVEEIYGAAVLDSGLTVS